MGLAISIGISPRESLPSWMDVCAELEDAGVSELWLIDSQLAMKDVFTGLALAAQRTERMTLGTGVVNLQTRHPTVTANAIAAIAELSQGRAALGIGAGDSSVFALGRRPSKVAEVRDALSFFSDVLSGRPGTWEERTYELAQSAPAHPRSPRGQPTADVPAGGRAGRRGDRDGPGPARPAQPPARLDRGGHRGRGRDRREDVAWPSSRRCRSTRTRPRRWPMSAHGRPVRHGCRPTRCELPDSLAPFADELQRAKARLRVLRAPVDAGRPPGQRSATSSSAHWRSPVSPSTAPRARVNCWTPASTT